MPYDSLSLPLVLLPPSLSFPLVLLPPSLSLEESVGPLFHPADHCVTQQKATNSSDLIGFVPVSE